MPCLPELHRWAARMQVCTHAMSHMTQQHRRGSDNDSSMVGCTAQVACKVVKLQPGCKAHVRQKQGSQLGRVSPMTQRSWTAWIGTECLILT
jgi:hypothetical protein